MDINIELFKRTAPEKKLAIIKEASIDELKALTTDSIKRMIREAGTRRREGHVAKELYIDREMAHNDRNSSITCIYQGDIRDTWYIDVYIQGYDTDRVVSTTLDNFFEYREVASFVEEYLTSPKITIHAYYEPEDKARVYKAICIAYIENKYADKLVKES